MGDHSTPAKGRASTSNTGHRTNCVFNISAICAIWVYGIAASRKNHIEVCYWLLAAPPARQMLRCCPSLLYLLGATLLGEKGNHLTSMVRQILSFSEACLVAMRTDLVQKHGTPLPHLKSP